jgi:hypothetical protein
VVDHGSVGTSELRAMQQLAQAVWAADPAMMNTGASVGELAWSWGAGSVLHATEWRHRLWFDGDRIAAWGWISAAEMIRVADDRSELSATSLVWQARPNHPELLDEVLEWFDDEASGANRCTTARAADRGAIERLERHGYVRVAPVTVHSGEPAQRPFDLALSRRSGCVRRGSGRHARCVRARLVRRDQPDSGT